MSNVATLETQRKLTRRQWWIGGITLVAISLFAAASLLAYERLKPLVVQPEAPVAIDEAPALPVNLQELVWVDSIEQTRAYTGTIRAKRRSELAFELPGKVTQIFVDEGDQVTEGDILAQLDTETLKAQQAAVKAQLAQAQSVLDELTAGPRIEKINSAKADVKAAESELKNAQQRLERRSKLIRTRAIPEEEFAQSKYDLQSAQANYDAAAERLAELEAGTRQEKITAQAATVRQLEATADELEVALSKSILKAPFDATITRRYLDQGSIAQPSIPVVKLVEQDQLEAWIGLPVELATSIKDGESYPIRIGTQKVYAELGAKIRELDAATRTQTVLFRLDSNDAVVPGQLCKIELTSEVPASGFWIPNDALAKGIRGLWTVMVVVEDEAGDLRVQKRDIEIVKTDSRRVLAKGTIKAGDVIIANGVHRVTEGQRVVGTAAPATSDLTENSITESLRR